MYRPQLLLITFALALLFMPLLAVGGSATLFWDANPERDIAGYRIYYGTGSANYPNILNVGNVTSHTIENLQGGVTYYFAIVAYDRNGNRSGYSSEVFGTIPGGGNGGDRTPPNVVSATLASPRSLDVVFSEAVGSASAQNIANYSISPNVTINSAALQADRRTVVLSTRPHAAGRNYTLTVRNISDAASPPNVMASPQSISYSSDPVDPRSLPAFYPTDDAYVHSDYANANYGSAQTLRIRESGGLQIVSYLKFKLRGLRGSAQRATLRLYATRRSSEGGELYSVSNNYRGTNTPWTQSGLRWNNSPEINRQALSTAGAVASDSWVEIDVTGAISGDGTYSFALVCSNNKTVFYHSKEGQHPSELVIGTRAQAASRQAQQEESASEELEISEAAPEKFNLSPAYPNPFNGLVTIEYALPDAGEARLTIYNSLGQAVRKLVDGIQSAGYKRAQWDATDDHGRRVGSGVYFYQLECARQVHTGRVIFQQ